MSAGHVTLSLPPFLFLSSLFSLLSALDLRVADTIHHYGGAATLAKVFRGINSLVDVGGGLGVAAQVVSQAFPESTPSPPPPHVSLPGVLSAAAFLSALPEGRQLHGLAAKLGLAPVHTVVANSLLHLYSSCGLPGAALDLFRRIPERSLVSWNTAVDALVGNGDHLAALDLFREMQRDTELAPDAYTVQSVLGACG
uniref:O-methyltransferase C-terminal domain-containing protein n=1 Tax=Oryza punctata TaxID=4537 RepID=A0A0E0KH58_ORYPU